MCVGIALTASAPGAQVAAQVATPGVDGTACTQGVVSAVELDRRPVFDPESTRIGALAWTFRFLNLLHVTTAASFIRGELLFEVGDCFDPFLVSESERLLDDYRFLARAIISSEEDETGGHQLVVQTIDQWSTQVDLGVTYDDGLNFERLEVTEQNFLGRGIFAEFTRFERREIKTRTFGLATPRFFGRADASIALGQGRAGDFFNEFVRYPFIGETGSFSLRQGYGRGTDYFAYSTDGTEAFSQVLVRQFREVAEVSAARRFRDPGNSIIAGVTLTRDVTRFPGVPQVAVADNFDELQPFPSTLPASLADQLRPSASTRVALHLGTRRYRYVEYFGLDGITERLLVNLGLFAGVTIGRGFDLLAPDGVPGVEDYFGRAHVNFGAPLGSSLFHGAMTVESRRESGAFRDVLADADLVAYLRNDGLQSHTLFVRGSVAGGWKASLPFQLSLGGRQGVRSLVEDRFPGGRMARFVVEDRIAFPWPGRSADLGMTAFADMGRVWPGDVPYALDSGWQAAVGFGLRLGLPTGTRNVWRADMAFPVGPTGGSPIFRFSFELNRLRSGFLTPDVFRSRRFGLGAEHF